MAPERNCEIVKFSPVKDSSSGENGEKRNELNKTTE